MFYWLYKKHASASALIHPQQAIYWIFTQTKLSSFYRHKPIATYWALMKRHALLTIWAKVKLAIQLFFRSKSKTLVKSSLACGKRRKTLKPWNDAISQHIQLVFFPVLQSGTYQNSALSSLKLKQLTTEALKQISNSHKLKALSFRPKA